MRIRNHYDAWLHHFIYTLISGLEAGIGRDDEQKMLWPEERHRRKTSLLTQLTAAAWTTCTGHTCIHVIPSLGVSPPNDSRRFLTPTRSGLIACSLSFI